MINNKKIAVVISCYNEQDQIGKVIETIPDFVDRIIVVDDCSKDSTSSIVSSYIKNDKSKLSVIQKNKKDVKPNKYNKAEMISENIIKSEDILYTPHEVLNINLDLDSDRIVLIRHKKNAGAGAAMATGYKWCRDYNIDCVVNMDGDGQMDPAELELLCLPIVNENIDYVKGNRLIHRSAPYVIPKIRYWGNSLLSMLTKIASGYWHISDTQTGYTAISLLALKSIQLHKIYHSYGRPNDMLIKLNMAYCTVKEVGIKPVYNVGEKSKMKIWKVIPGISCLLIKSFFIRLFKKYFARDFHPLFLFYNFGFLLFLINLPIAIRLLTDLFLGNKLTYQVLIIFMFLAISSFQSIFFAMWMDIQDNERLYK